MKLRVFNWDKAFTATIYLIVGIVSLLFLFLIYDIVVIGVQNLSLTFLTGEVLNSGREGGIGPIIVSTLLILFVSLIASIPIGMMTAIFLSIIKTRYVAVYNSIGHILNILASIPSVVFGLFGNILFCQVLGMGFSILSGGLTLSCMVLPIFIKSSVDAISCVSREAKLSGYALGLSDMNIYRKIILPEALNGIMAGLILGIGRSLAETAALIFTSGYVDRMPESLMDSGRSLSIHIYDLSMNVSGADHHAYSSALILIILIFLSIQISWWVANRYLAKKGHIYVNHS
jgi:phosphate transport system permease protein